MYFWISFTITLLLLYRSSKRKRIVRQVYKIDPNDAKKVKDHIKQRNKIELAKYDIDDLEALVFTYRELLDSIDEELEDTTSKSKKTILLSKRANIEAKIHSANRKINIAYQVTKEEL